MKFIITTSDSKYFHWQLLVQYNNFKKYGYEKDLIWVYSFKDVPSKEMIDLIKGLNVTAYGIKDKRGHIDYSSSIRPFILSKFFNQRKDLENEAIFYTDPDVLFKKKFSTAKLLNNDVWYLSDTISYLSSTYIKSKGEKLFHEMCDIVGIDPELVEKNDKNAGGAQYLMKNLNADFWEKVYVDSERLYVHMNKTSDKYNPEHPIQAWTADMWAVLWNAWLFGHETKIIKRMDFSWATDHIDKVNKEGIYHNAGVFDQKDLFNKGKFSTNHPFNENFSYVDTSRGSYYYVKEIIDTKENYKDLIKKL